MPMRCEMLLLAVLGNMGQIPSASEAHHLNVQAKALQESGKYEEARTLYEQALKADSSNAEAQDGFGKTTERLALQARGAGHNDEALAELLRARKIVPSSTRILFDLGVLEEEMHLYHDADATLGALEKATPGQANVLYAVARVKLDLGQFAAAESHIQTYLTLRPEDASAHYGLGNIYLQAAELDKARTEFERSIAIQPLQTEAYYQLGEVYLQQDRYADAERSFEKTLERNPKHGGALVGLGACYFKQSKFDVAANWLRKAVEAAPEYQPGHYYLGLALRRLGNVTESKRELEIATKLAEEDSKRGANRLRLNEPATPP